jgi:hypothetical protein
MGVSLPLRCMTIQSSYVGRAAGCHKAAPRGGCSQGTESNEPLTAHSYRRHYIWYDSGVGDTMGLYRTDAELARLATRLRDDLGLAEQCRPDMMTVIQKAKARYRHFGYLRVPDDEMGEAEASWDNDAGVLRMRESVFRAMQRGEPRARMTIAHELAHFILKHEGVHNRNALPGVAERVSARLRREESEAKRFAALFLAPTNMIPTSCAPAEIAEKFGLSAEAAAIRAEEVADDRRRSEGRQRQLPSVVVDFLNEARQRGVTVRTELD